MFYYKGPKSDHFDGKCFYNPWNPRKHSWKKVFHWMMTSEPHPWPKKVENEFEDIPPARVTGPELRVSFVGHSTVLIQTQGLNIVTDPVWTERIAPLQLGATKRVAKPGIAFERLPKIDLILISHNHYDHLNRKTVQMITKRDHPLIITPLGNDTIIKSFDPSIKVRVLDWDQSLKVSDQVTIHLEPSQHWSGRGIFDVDKALWGAFVIETTGGNIYFAGDTGFEAFLFEKCRAKFGSFRLCLLPIGIYEPRWLMQYVHMNPQEALSAFKLLGEPNTIGIHYGTFRLADESYEAPLELLAFEKKLQGIPENNFRVLKIGESCFFGCKEPKSPLP